VSVWVQASLSLQGVLFGFGVFEQTPLLGSHVPASWHWLRGLQMTGFMPVHVPPWQLSVWVHALPSLQGVLFGFEGLEQTPVIVSQVPTSWH
jgi:hypothetical protein